MFGNLTKRRRFILVDPSFDGKSGDKWQYAMTFCDFARRNKFDFVLLAHKDAPFIQGEAGGKVDQRNVFSAGFYHHGEIINQHTLGDGRRRIRASDVEMNQRLKALDEKIARFIEAGEFVNAERARQDRAAALSRYIEETATLLGAVERAEPLALPFNRDAFAQELHAELNDIKPRQGDILFLHTATQAIMESLTEISALMEQDETLDIDAYFLFHFGAEAPDARTFIDRYYSFSHCASLGARLKSGSPFRRLHLLATHPLLREELEGFFGLPVGIFDGLTNLDRYMTNLGGIDGYVARRTAAAEVLAADRPLLGVRAADLTQASITALQMAVRMMRRCGAEPSVRVAHHAKNRAKAAEVIAALDDDVRGAFRLEDTDDHARYISFLAASSIVVLPYNPDIYKKRVSAVLHDCSVLGVPCIVPRHSTLQDGRDFADIYIYDSLSGLAGVTIRAWRALRADPERARRRKARADELFASDVVSRLLKSTSRPSLTVQRRGPVATVFMPLWGRVGSSYAIEAQIRFLLEAGYFVVQVLALDKPADHVEARPFFWRMLFENSRAMRGSLMRIAYRTANPSLSSVAERADGFDAYLNGVAHNSLWDPGTERLIRKSAVTVVNHVFNSRLAQRLGGGYFILETHDIQSRQMMHWPLRDPVTGEPEDYRSLIEKELAEVSRYDYVINVSHHEHKVLQLANQNSRVVTPYLLVDKQASQFESIAAMAHAYNWHESYLNLSKLDILLIGDSHPANLESCVWFMEKVFKPFLAPQSVRLGIVGRVTDQLYQRFNDIPSVFYCGFVDEIADIRHLSRLTVLPDQRGTGISIKTLETLAYSAPFVGTSVAFRGIDAFIPPEELDVYDQPETFGARVLALLGDEEALAETGRQAGELYTKVSGRARFDNAWREIFTAQRLPQIET